MSFVKEPTVDEVTVWSDGPGLWSIQYHDKADNTWHQFDDITFSVLLIKLCNLGF